MKEYLDSDRLNFLVWRYLLEGNFRDTAAKFQKEWHVQAPHRELDFAPYVRTRALVNVVNKGLNLLALERSYSEQLVSATETSAQPKGIFGPLITQPPPFHKEEPRDATVDGRPASATASAPVAGAPAPPTSATATDITPSAANSTPNSTLPAAPALPPPADDADGTKKRQIDTKQQPQQNGSPAKKQRLSNGHDATVSSADAAHTAQSTPMDIDGNENQHAYPSPMEREPASTPVPRTDGPEQGTQVDKVEELAPDTTFLRLAPDFVADSNSLMESQQPGHENPIVLHCEWNPTNPAVLAAAGTDALARIWTISRAGEPVADHVNGLDKSYKDLVDEDGAQHSTVTALAWNPSGTSIALATEAGSKSRVGIWSPDGTLLHQYNVREPPVIKLRWHPNGTSILGVAPEGSGTLVTVFSALAAGVSSYLLKDHDLSGDPLDVAWTSETSFLVCGGDLLAAFSVTENGIVPARTFNTGKDERFTTVQYDPLSRIAATASERGVIDLWDENGERRTISAHIGLITSLAWQPLQSTTAPDDERLLASGGEDGAITIWNARLPDSKPKCSMTMDLPVMAVAFTPDGAFIAGATPDRILIWKVGDHAIPRASWRREPHPGWHSPRLNNDGDDEDTHCLCWDATGQKLAYGVNNRLAVINFR
ncbi:WD repeat protein [Sporothrix brasiliensis 5110]|uniref:WD repeat protein n=1 Tax=Sporothrix brasiliensis 5110 TaxID=1398154 RepID=A0A0C2J049_9PEZI|nr:WD repeat protein [Sporothrix brasiliensis 5110]KIH94726.1 WD repeat protein [Sporothrix brasiliensis 5110]